MTLARPSPRVAALLEKRRTTRGRLIFGIDATASRQDAWDLATSLTASMFETAAAVGGLDVQVIAYGGHDEFRKSPWHSDVVQLIDWMQAIRCKAGATQIERVLRHIRSENERERIAAAVFVGNAVEEEPRKLYAAAAVLGVPLFVFQEGNEWAVPPDRYAPPLTVEQVFREIARINGAYGRFDSGAGKQLGELLRAVVAFAMGGISALAKQNSKGAQKLLSQFTPAQKKKLF